MNTENLTSFLRLLAGRDQAAVLPLTERVQLAAHDAAAYFGQHADELEERGMDEETDATEVPGFTQLVLVDRLVAADLAAEVDWKSDAEEISWAISQVLTQQGRPTQIDLEADDNEDTEEALARTRETLAALGLTLLELDLSSDSYPLTVVPTAQAAEVLALAASLGFGVRAS